MEKVEDCVLLTPQSVREIPWLPPTCAYSLLAQGKDLYWWHPLVSGDPESVHAAGYLGARPGRRLRKPGAGFRTGKMDRELAREAAA